KAQQPTPTRVFPHAAGAGPKSLEPVANFVASLHEGERNRGTYWGFCRALDAADGGLASESEAINLITEAALRNGLSLGEVRQIAKSARNRSRRNIQNVN